MAKVEGFMIRISEEQHTKLKGVAESVGLKLTDLGRIAVEGLLNYVDAHNGKLHLPLDFTTAWTRLNEIMAESDAECAEIDRVAKERARQIHGPTVLNEDSPEYRAETAFKQAKR